MRYCKPLSGAAQPRGEGAHDPKCYYLRSSDMDGDEAARCDCHLASRQPAPPASGAPRCANGHVLGKGPHFCDECGKP